MPHHLAATPGLPLASQLLEALDEAVVAVVAVDLCGQVVFWNSAAEQLSGYAREEVTGHQIYDLLLPEHAGAELEKWVSEVVTTGPASRDWSVRDRQGRHLAVAVAGTPVRAPDGSVTGVVGVCRDVSDRDLVRSQFRARFHHSGMPQSFVGRDLRLQAVNDACCALLRRPREDLVGRHVRELVVGEEGGDTLGGLLRGADDGATQAQRAHLLHRGDGSTVPVLLTSSVVLDRDGQAIGATSYITDLTELHRAQEDLSRREALFRALVQRASDVAIVTGVDGTVRYVSPAIEQVLGFDPDVVLEVDGWRAVHPDDQPQVRDAFQDVLTEPDRSGTATYRHRHADGTWRWVEATFTNRASDPDIDGVVVNLRDVTERRMVERALSASEVRYRTMAETAQEGIWVGDPGGRTVFANAKLAELLGRSLEELSTTTALTLFGPDVEPVLAQRLGASRELGVVEHELRYPHPDGEQRWLRISSSPLHDEASQYLGSLGMVSDLTAIRRGEEALRRLALHDPVTDLPNRTLLQDRLAQAVDRSRRSGTPVAVLFVDVDRFKHVNDALGHVAGDGLLRAVGQRLAAGVRPGDTVARFGGDEFVVVLEDADGALAEQTALALRTEVAAPFDVDGAAVHVTASIGIATTPAEGAEELLMRADAAMYQAKSCGLGRVERFDPVHSAALRDRLALTADLRLALLRGQLALHYQPIVDLSTGALLGFEALIRWEHAARGSVAASVLVAVAEEGGFAPDLDHWVLHAACDDVARLRRAGVLPDDAYLAVNISASHLSDGDLEGVVDSATRTSGLSPSSLVLEVTESAVMADTATSQRVLQRLRALGVSVALDDFGTGYSSLAYLKHLPVDRLKIDRMFVEHLAGSGDDVAIVASVVELAKAVGATVVAEGVETPEQLALLHRLRCHAGQGWLWSPAVALSELPALMASYREQRFRVSAAAAPATPASELAQEPVSELHGLHRLLELQQAGASLRTIAAALNTEGFRTPRGTRWHPRSIAAVLTQRSYPALWERPDGPA